MTTALWELVRETIGAHGPITFADYMTLALYHPELGYYASGAERTGWRGHFLTSSELDPAWAQLWARGFEQIWEGCGRPDDFALVEVGPGEGTFAAAVLDSVRPPFADAISYNLVEPVPALQARQSTRLDGHPRVAWADSLDALPTISAGCVFANEVLDNFPVHVATRHEGVIRELHVEVAGDALTFVPLAPSTPAIEDYLERVGVDLPEGHIHEIGLAAEDFVARAGRAFDRGALVLVDYGDTASVLATRPGGTLLSYSASGVDDRVLDDPGGKDITTHVNWTAVAAACSSSQLQVAGPRPQHNVLRALGSGDIDAELRAAHDAAVTSGHGAGAIAALSRRQALGVLADPGGLGALDVFVAVRGMPVPDFMSH
jgi:SAM-dependent MidA family methyltransferase